MPSSAQGQLRPLVIPQVLCHEMVFRYGANTIERPVHTQMMQATAHSRLGYPGAEAVHIVTNHKICIATLVADGAATD